ncbi:MAG: adenylate/guanylate cyclase domain-containing protein [Treponema sp.]|nr:adenylate/guanylate cyclase domain-containing protein [Treponema sp.]
MNKEKETKTKEKTVKARKVTFPISTKLVLIFSVLVILVLGITTYMVSTLVRNDNQVKAEENNHTLNGRTAETVQQTFQNVQNNANGFLNTLLLIKDSENYQSEMDLLFGDFIERNPSVVFLYTSDIGMKMSSAFESAHSQAGTQFINWLKINSDIEEKVLNGEILVKNISFISNSPVVCVMFPHYNSYIEKTDFVTVAFSVDQLISLMSTGSYNMTFLLNKDGEVLIHSDEQMMLNNTDLSYLEIVRTIKTSDNQNSQKLLPDEKGDRWFYAYHKIIGDMVVVTCVSENDVFETIKRTTYRIVLISLIVFFLAILIIRWFSKSLTHPIDDLVDATKSIEKGEYNFKLVPKTHDEIGYLTGNFMEMAGGLEERERLMSSFSKFTNKVIAQKAAKGELEIGGQNKNATIFFSDIRSFTALSEKLSPNEVVDFLNDYFARMCECVDKTSGIVDKFIGDAVMAVWGAPESAGNPEADAWNAVKAALMMRIALYHLNQQRIQEGKVPVKIGCGINSGPIVAGQIGSADHMNYTVIGDTVNLASRTEALNKPFATDILITENTYELIKDKVIVEEMPGVHVKGKEAAIKMYAVINAVGVKGPDNIHKLREFLGWNEPDLAKVNTDEEEKKYKING